MSKNLTLKGIAFGALVALGSTVLAGAPAQAATVNGITTTIDGTLTKLPVWSETFSIKFKLPATTSDLKFEIANPNGLDLGASTVIENADVDYAGLTTDVSGAGIIQGTATEVSTAQVWAFPSSDSTTRSVVTIDAVDGGDALTSDKSVSVTAFVDVNDNNVADSGEKSETVKIEWVKSVTSTFTLDQPFVGEDTLTANVGLTGINLAQVDTTKIKANFYDNQTATADFVTEASPFVSGDTTLALDVADLDTDYLLGGQAVYALTVQDAHRYYAQLELNGSTVGSLISKNVVRAVTAAVTEPTVTAGANFRIAAAGDVRVRPGTTSFAISAKGTKVDTTSVGAGKKAKVTVTANSLTSGASLTIGSKVLTTGSYTFEATTNSDGKVLVNLTGAGFKEADDFFTVEINIEGVTSVNPTNTTFTVDAVDSYMVANTESFAGVKAIKPGALVSLNYAITDEYGVAPSDRLRAEVTFGNGGANDFVGKPEFVNGKLAISYTDTFAATTALPRSYDVTLFVQKRDAETLVWDYVDTDTNPNTVTPVQDTTQIHLVAGASATALNFKADNDGSSTAVAVTSQTLAAADERLGGTVTDYTDGGTDGQAVELTGVAEDKDNNVVPGAVVTIKATGSAVFVANSGTASEVSAVNTITVNADENGAFSVVAFSQTGGNVTYTATSGSLSETAKVVYAQGTLAAGSTLVYTGGAYATPGSVFNATFVLKDKLGNPIANEVVALSLTGAAGWLANETATTNSSGVVSARLVTGISDAGAVVVTAFVENGSNDLTTLANVTIGAAPVVATAAASGSTGKFFASVTNAAGKKVVVKVSGKFVTSFTGTAAKKSVAIAALKGNRTVTIYVGGTLVLTKLVTIK